MSEQNINEFELNCECGEESCGAFIVLSNGVLTIDNAGWVASIDLPEWMEAAMLAAYEQNICGPLTAEVE